MPNDELLAYVKSQLHEGVNRETIKNALIRVGWAENEINQALSVFEQPPQTAKIPPDDSDDHDEPNRLTPRIFQRPVIQTAAAIPTTIPHVKAESDQISFGPSGNATVSLEKSSSKKWLLSLLVFLIFITALVAPFLYFYNKQKDELQNLISKQSNNFSQLKKTYKDIADLNKEESSRNKRQGENSVNLLRLPEGNQPPSVNVLGLEDDPTIIALRKLGELYSQGEKQAEEIRSLNRQIEGKTIAIPINLLIPKSTALFEKTDEFANSNRLIFIYLEKDNQLLLKSFNAFVEISAAFSNIELRGIDESSLKMLNDKIKNIDGILTQYSALETDSLPLELRVRHSKTLGDIPKIKKVFQDTSDSFRSPDPNIILDAAKNLVSLMIESTASEEISRVEIIRFWEDKQEKSAEELKNEWDSFGQKLPRKISLN